MGTHAKTAHTHIRGSSRSSTHTRPVAPLSETYVACIYLYYTRLIDLCERLLSSNEIATLLLCPHDDTTILYKQFSRRTFVIVVTPADRYNPITHRLSHGRYFTRALAHAHECEESKHTLQRRWFLRLVCNNSCVVLLLLYTE